MSAPFTKLYTLVFCVERVQQSASRILLGMKKRGFGSGKWNGFGGKVEPSDASIEHAACREMAEECSVHVAPDALIKRGLLRFQFRANMAMTMEVHVYEASAWTGEAVESDEMRPQWFPIADIPYASMWADDEHWLSPLFLENKSFRGHFVFDDERIESHSLNEVDASEL